MHFLLTNDDGIHAPGIRALGEAARAAGHRVSVCAPDRERSAASHSITLPGPLKARKLALDWADAAWAVDGTPADCARLGVWLTRNDPADVVLSGINRGMNLGGACVYSGTVGAAQEAAMAGAIALGVSLCVFPGLPEDYSAAARLGVRVAEWAAAHPLPGAAMYNLNVPSCPYEALKGLVAARMAPVFVGGTRFTETPLDDGAVAYEYHFEDFPDYPDPDLDFERVKAGWATITKLTWDFRLPEDDTELNGIGL